MIYIYIPTILRREYKKIFWFINQEYRGKTGFSTDWEGRLVKFYQFIDICCMISFTTTSKHCQMSKVNKMLESDNLQRSPLDNAHFSDETHYFSYSLPCFDQK